MSIISQRIVVVLPSPMGDAILCGPALRRLRTSLPESYIALLGNGTVKEVLAGNPWGNEFVVYDKKEGLLGAAQRLRRGRFNGAILLTNSFRSALLVRAAGISRRIGYKRGGRGFLLTHPVAAIRLGRRYAPISMADYYGYLVDKAIAFLGGAPPAEEAQEGRLELFSTTADREEVTGLLGRWSFSDADRLVMLVPGGAFGGSKWWLTDRYAALADKLSGQGWRVVICCAPNETERRIAEEIMAVAKHRVYNLTEEGVSLGGVKELVRRCRLMISNDTGPCHMAAAWEVPLVTIFGPTDPRWTATGYDKEIRLRRKVDCGPCQEAVCREDHRCMKAISVDDVYQAAKQLLAASEHSDGPVDSVRTAESTLFPQT